MTEDKTGTLDREQLDRLVQYFNEAVVSARNYKPPQGEVSHIS